MHGLPTTEEEENMKRMNEIMKSNPQMMGSTPYDRELYGRKDGINAPSIPFAQ
jgi:hypothetical protein